MLDKVADRIAGAIVDLAYAKTTNPKIAVEVLIGHKHATVMIESSVRISKKEVEFIVWRISGIENLNYVFSFQDPILASNQKGHLRCGDNGIFKGTPVTAEQGVLADITKQIYSEYLSDGKYIYDLENHKLIICQSNAKTEVLREEFPKAIINPLGDWTGGTDVDCGATNRKLGSDMGDSVTGGGLHGKDLSKADVSVNIYAFLKAQKSKEIVELCCAIGDETIDGLPYSDIVEIARDYINALGGFEKFAEYGLIR